MTVTGVFVVTLLMAAMSGLGALPFFFVPRLSPRLASLANATACGVMLAASFDLIHEGEPHGPSLVVLGLLCGAVFIAFLQRFLRDFEDVEFAALRGADARKTALVVGIMTAHALGEGTGVGVSFGGVDGWAQGRLVALAIGVHNVPEGMAVATVLAAKGVSPRECALWAAVTSAPQALLAAPAFAFVETFAALLPFGLGFAAGCMAWITVAELLPDALEGADAATVATWATASAAALEAFRMLMNAAEARTADAAEAASLFSSSSSSSAPGGSAGVPLMGSSSDAGLNPSVAGPGVEQHPGLTLGATLRLAAASFVVPALLAAAAKLAARDYSKSDALGNGALPVTTHFSASANGNGGANGLGAVSKDERGASRGARGGARRSVPSSETLRNGSGFTRGSGRRRGRRRSWDSPRARGGRSSGAPLSRRSSPRSPKRAYRGEPWRRRWARSRAPRRPSSRRNGSSGRRRRRRGAAAAGLRGGRRLPGTRTRSP